MVACLWPYTIMTSKGFVNESVTFSQTKYCLVVYIYMHVYAHTTGLSTYITYIYIYFLYNS